MPRLKLRSSCHLDGPAEGESFMKREGVSGEGDDLPEWLDNETGLDVDGLPVDGDEADDGDDSDMLELD